MSRMNEKMSVRLPASMKRKVVKEAKVRLLQPTDIVREALQLHLSKPKQAA